MLHRTHAPRKRFGQHFLTDAGVIDASATDAGAAPRRGLGRPDAALGEEGGAEGLAGLERLDAQAQRVARLRALAERLLSSGGNIEPILWELGALAGLVIGAAFGDPLALAAVEDAQRYIHSGDIYQVNLTQRLSAPWSADAWELFRRLADISPAPCAAFVDCGDFQLASSSPELFMRLSGTHIQTRPIKGTRPRSADATRDAQLAYELQTSTKEQAELVMITDLLRNDLGRVCQPGSIRVPQLVGLESYANVHHLTSVVTGELRQECSWVDLLRACWPGGSISGAPKLRACQRLAELEPVPRGPYCGSLLRRDWDGSVDSSILIRTLLLKDRELRLQAGCGIVADSDPLAEAEELGWKLHPLQEALA
mgnify:CR=1 FL=1